MDFMQLAIILTLSQDWEAWLSIGDMACCDMTEQILMRTFSCGVNERQM